MLEIDRTKLSLPFLRRRVEEEAAHLPALLTAADRAAASILGGTHRQRKAGSGEKFWQFREYHPGDRPQDIDWRQSAKTDDVFIRQKEWQTTQTALMWASSNPGMHYHSRTILPTKRETALVLTLALSRLMNHAGTLTGLLEGGMLPGRTENALSTLGQGLLENPPSSLPQADIAKIPRHAGLFLAADFLETPEEIEKSFSNLAARTGQAVVIQVLDPAELSLPFHGRVVFEDTHSAQSHHIANVAAVRDAYRARMETHLRDVQAVCRRLHWNWILHTTDTPITDTLFILRRLFESGHLPEGGAV